MRIRLAEQRQEVLPLGLGQLGIAEIEKAPEQKIQLQHPASALPTQTREIRSTLVMNLA
jgi:hypothetical protein